MNTKDLKDIEESIGIFVVTSVVTVAIRDIKAGLHDVKDYDEVVTRYMKQTVDRLKEIVDFQLSSFDPMSENYDMNLSPNKSLN